MEKAARNKDCVYAPLPIWEKRVSYTLDSLEGNIQTGSVEDNVPTGHMFGPDFSASSHRWASYETGPPPDPLSRSRTNLDR